MAASFSSVDEPGDDNAEEVVVGVCFVREVAVGVESRALNGMDV